MATFVLVAGACCGGWSWRKLAPLLRAAGHEVHTPTLTGLGERVHLARPDVDREWHIADIVNVLDFEDLRNVTLVGWSYGGLVSSGVADRVPDRLKQVIHLDATVVEDGQNLYDAWPDGVDWRAPARIVPPAGPPPEPGGREATAGVHPLYREAGPR